MGFIDDVVDHLENTLTLPTIFKVDILSEDDVALCIRRVPSSPTIRYIDRSRDDDVAFQILTKDKNQQNAIQMLEDISVALERLLDLPSSDESYQYVKMELYTLPMLVEKTDRNNFIYSALFRATLYKQY